MPDKGAFVSKPSADEAREVYAVRRILETALAREFTARARPADFRRIEAHLARERQALESGDAQARNRLLGDFHLLLAEIVGNQVLTDMLRELLARSAVITALYQSTHDAGCSSREHRAFIQAARKGDADAASALMDEHLRHVLDALISRPARKATPTWSPRCCADAPSLVRLIQRKARRRQADTVLHAAGVRRMPRQAPRAGGQRRAPATTTRMPGDAICTNTS